MVADLVHRYVSSMQSDIYSSTDELEEGTLVAGALGAGALGAGEPAVGEQVEVGEHSCIPFAPVSIVLLHMKAR